MAEYPKTGNQGAYHTGTSGSGAQLSEIAVLPTIHS